MLPIKIPRIDLNLDQDQNLISARHSTSDNSRNSSATTAAFTPQNQALSKNLSLQIAYRKRRALNRPAFADPQDPTKCQQSSLAVQGTINESVLKAGNSAPMTNRRCLSQRPSTGEPQNKVRITPRLSSSRTYREHLSRQSNVTDEQIVLDDGPESISGTKSPRSLTQTPAGRRSISSPKFSGGAEPMGSHCPDSSDRASARPQAGSSPSPTSTPYSPRTAWPRRRGPRAWWPCPCQPCSPSALPRTP